VSTPQRNRQQQIQLTTFDNEPLARLSEQRLRQEGIPCLIRSLQGGPGLWGSAYNLPHALYVFESDEMRAREVLDLPPQEVLERGEKPTTPARGPSMLVFLVVAAVLLVLIIAGPSLAGMFGG
jgi:hypothetical protein